MVNNKRVSVPSIVAIQAKTYVRPLHPRSGRRRYQREGLCRGQRSHTGVTSGDRVSEQAVEKDSSTQGGRTGSETVRAPKIDCPRTESKMRPKARSASHLMDEKSMSS